MLHPTSEPPKNFGTPMLFNGRRKSITSDGLAEDNSPIPSYPGSQEADDTPTALRRNLTRTPYSPQSPSRSLQVTSRTGLVFLGVIAFSTSVGAMAWSSMGSSVAARPAPQTRQLGEVVNAEAIAAMETNDWGEWRLEGTPMLQHAAPNMPPPTLTPLTLPDVHCTRGCSII